MADLDVTTDVIDTTGTWLGITRSAESFWQSRLYVTPSIPGNTFYFLANDISQCVTITGIGYPEPIDPALRLPEGF